VLVDAAEKKLADARAALPGLEATAKTADTNAAAATAAVVKAEENLRLAEQSVTTSASRSARSRPGCPS
jgi:hypothetical protein